jgi:anti-sigma factor RsiW
MSCRETKDLLNAYVDGELDSASSRGVEKHIEGCTSCLADVENLHALASAIHNGGLRFSGSQRLKRNVATAIRKADPQTTPAYMNWRWVAAVGSMVLIVAATWMIRIQRLASSEQTQVVNEIISSHVRSLMANHITDVASSDSHTVKPWFSGKLDYSPPATDLTDRGFRLVGGRLDYIGGRPVAAVVYQRSQHWINLFVWPSSSGPIAEDQVQLTRQGYNLIHWNKAGMSYWLISELNLAELTECARLLQN